MAYRAAVKEIPEHIIYFKEYVIEDMEQFYFNLEREKFLQELSDLVLRENPQISLTDPDYNVLLYVDGEFKEKSLRVEFCDAVTGYGKDNDVYKFRKVPSFLAVKVLHKGPYKRLSEAYSYAYQWMAEHGYEQNGNPRNSAIDGFWNREAEADYLTEIQIPVKKVVEKEV